MKRGYGLLVAQRREVAGMSPEDLAARMKQTASTVRRIEAETTEPSVRQINALVASLPLSAEELLGAMGVTLSAPAASRLPKRLLDILLQKSPEQWEQLANVLDPTVKAR